jgi:hypothetical protein
MPATVYTGLPGQGKTLKLAERLIEVLQRNKKWYKITKVRRLIYHNFEINEKIVTQNKEWFVYWRSLVDLHQVREADVFYDEIGLYYDSQNWEKVSFKSKRWLALHEHFGCELYGTAQSYGQVAIQFRRITTKLLLLRKLAGSRRPSKTKPPVRFAWGFCYISELDPQTYDEKEQTNDAKFIFDWIIIRKKNTSIYNTNADETRPQIEPFEHEERECIDPEHPNCGFKKIYHY